MALVLFVPFGEVCSLMHVLDDLPPADSGIVSAEANLAFLRAVGNDAHLSAAEIVVEQILEPHAFDAEYAPDIVWIVLSLCLHTVVAIRARVCRRRFEEIQYLVNWETRRRFFSVEVSQNRHA